jgi:hypothetical protein
MRANNAPYLFTKFGTFRIRDVFCRAHGALLQWSRGRNSALRRGRRQGHQPDQYL